MPKNALRFEMIGQRDDVNLITLGCTQLMWNALCSIPVGGNEEPFPYRRVKKLGEYLARCLEKSDWTLRTPRGSRGEIVRWGIIRVNGPTAKPGAPTLYDYMYDAKHMGNKRIYGSGDKESFRLCPHIYNTINDVDTAVKAMNDWKGCYEETNNP